MQAGQPHQIGMFCPDDGKGLGIGAARPAGNRIDKAVGAARQIRDAGNIRRIQARKKGVDPGAKCLTLVLVDDIDEEVRLSL